MFKFTISKTYKDEVWCDVILIDACHLLLLRPWKFDRKVIHDGGKNTCTFWKDGTKFVLLPLKDEGKTKNMLSEKEIVKEMKETRFYYALIVQKGSEEDILIPTEVAKVLEEYIDVISNELLDGIPPKRDIQHRIDLILGSYLLNQESYKMSST